MHPFLCCAKAGQKQEWGMGEGRVGQGASCPLSLTLTFTGTDLIYLFWLKKK